VSVAAPVNLVLTDEAKIPIEFSVIRRHLSERPAKIKDKTLQPTAHEPFTSMSTGNITSTVTPLVAVVAVAQLGR
jgi:hypothetical protein